MAKMSKEEREERTLYPKEESHYYVTEQNKIARFTAPRKPLSPLQLMRRQAKERSEVKTYQAMRERSSVSGKIGRFFQGMARIRRAPIKMARNISASAYGPQLKEKYGRVGRPPMPSGKYVIPGVGAVGVYEFRAWQRAQNRIAIAQAQAQQIQQARQYRQGLPPQNIPMEQRTIPNTQGQIPQTKSIHEEIESYSHIFD